MSLQRIVARSQRRYRSRGEKRRGRPRAPDLRIVYGVGCTWWDSVHNVGVTRPLGRDGHVLPCCPKCGGMLMEVESAEVWWRNVDDFVTKKLDPGYRALIEWMRGRCFPTMAAARAAYTEAHPGSQP